MTILALDCSTNRRSAAILRKGEFLARLEIDAAPRGFSSVALAERVLKEAALPAAEIEKVVVGLGPGSYTGIRSSIAVAQAFALARNTRAAGVSSMLALARRAQREGWAGEFTFAIDAQRAEFYIATYRLGAGEMIEIRPLQLASREEVGKMPGKLAGPRLKEVFSNAEEIWPSAQDLALEAQEGAFDLPAETLEPIYLRETSFIKAPAPRWS